MSQGLHIARIAQDSRSDSDEESRKILPIYRRPNQLSETTAVIVCVFRNVADK